LCRAYTEESIRHLAAIMRQREDSAAARVQAANILLDRGWGKPPQAHTGEDGKNISVTIRQIVERGAMIEVWHTAVIGSGLTRMYRR